MGAEQSSMKNAARRSFAISGGRRFTHLDKRAGAFVHGGRGLQCEREEGAAKPQAGNKANAAGQRVAADHSPFDAQARQERRRALVLTSHR